MFFYKDTGNYDFNIELLHHAHRWCLNTAKIFLRQGKDVIVSNTFTQWKEMSDYIKFAKTLNIPIEIKTMSTQFKSIHDVPDDVMIKMKNRFESHEEIIRRI